MSRRKTFVLYDSKETEFKTNGLGVFGESNDISVLEVLNGEYSLTVKYPINSKSSLLNEFNIIKFDGQLFRIREIKRSSENGYIEVYAPHIFYDLEFFFIEDLRPNSSTIQVALNWIKENLGVQMPFNFYSDGVEVKTIYLQDKTMLAAIFDMMDRWDNLYELKRDNFDIHLNYSIDSNNHVLVAKGKNVRGITVAESASEIATRLLPVGYNGLKLPEVYINVPTSNTNLPKYPITKKIKFENIISDVTLRERAIQVAEHMAKVRRNIKLNFIELSCTEEYKDFKHLEKVSIGDKVVVKYSDFSIDETMKVIRLKRNMLTGMIEELELDQPANDVNAMINRIMSIDKKLDQLEEGQRTMNNTIWNSSFERFNSASKEPLHWKGGRSISFEKNAGNFCCLLEYGQTLETPEVDESGNKPRPTTELWNGDEGQFSFSKKGGECQLQLFDGETLEPLELILPNLEIKNTFNIPKTETWQLGTYMVKFKIKNTKVIHIKFTNIDADGDRVFLDTLQIEESRDSTINYRDGINSAPFDNYLSDMWLETVEVVYKPVVDIVFVKRYVKVPSFSITVDKLQDIKYTLEFVKETDTYNNSIEYYTGVRVIFDPLTPENEEVINITLIGRGV